MGYSGVCYYSASFPGLVGPREYGVHLVGFNQGRLAIILKDFAIDSAGEKIPVNSTEQTGTNSYCKRADIYKPNENEIGNTYAVAAHAESAIWLSIQYVWIGWIKWHV